MTPTHAAALEVIRESLAALRASIVDLPPGATDWHPWEGANSLAVLAAHAVTSLEFFAAAAAGNVGSFHDYRETERERAFRTTGVSPTSLLEAIDSAEHSVAAAFEGGTAEHLATTISLPGSPADGATGAAMLFRVVAHLREHVGHAQAVHDAWRARQAQA